MMIETCLPKAGNLIKKQIATPHNNVIGNDNKTQNEKIKSFKKFNQR